MDYTNQINSRIKECVEHFIVDTQQIFEHICGVNQITHYTRTCLLCQPINAKMQFPTPMLSALPPTFPSDLEYEIAKIKASERLSIPSGKQLVLINQEEYSTNQKTRRPIWAKEIILFLHTLGYTMLNPMPLYFAHTKYAITKAKKYKKKNKLLENDTREEVESKKIDENSPNKSSKQPQKFIFLCWGGFDIELLQRLLIICNPIATQIVLWIVDKPEEERKYICDKISKDELNDKTDRVFAIQFSSIDAIRRFHHMLLQREGRVTVENVMDYASENQNVNTFVHNKNKEKIEQLKNLSFIY